MTYIFKPIDRNGMIEVDRIMTEDLSIPVSLMMEHAGLNLARLTYNYIRYNDHVIIIAGTGNNAGGGITAARKLAGWGISTSIYLVKGKPTREIPKLQLKRAIKCGARIVDHLDDSDIIIDAFIGYNFKGKIDPKYSELFSYMRNSKVISLDVPSGLDSTNGRNPGQLKPLATATLAWPKSGMISIEKQFIGNLYLIDIGVPLYIYHELLDIPHEKLNQLGAQFAQSSLLNIDYTGDGWFIK